MRVPIGIGDAGLPYDAYCSQASVWNPLNWFYCLPHDVSTIASGEIGAGTVPMPPPPPPPNIALSTDPATATQPGAIYAGTDASGTPVYAVPQTADANMAAYKEQIKKFMDEVGDAHPPVDCTTFWNSHFNDSCGGSSLLLWGLGGLAAVLVLGAVFGARR